ncbi:hypothetical protein Tco_1344141 [Tanacetum coccineum]
MEHLMGDQYKNDKLLTLKPYKITAATLKPSIKGEVPLTAHLCNVAGIIPQPLQNLNPSSKRVNADESADKSLSETSVYLDAFESAEVQVNQPKDAASTEVLDQNVMEETEKADDDSRIIPTMEDLLNELDKRTKAAQSNIESIYDTESEILVVKSFAKTQLLAQMSDDIIRSPSGAELFASDNDADDTHSKHQSDANNEDRVDASAQNNPDLQSLHDHLDHVCENVTMLHNKVADLEDSVTSKVYKDIQSSVPAMITTALKEQMPGLLSAALQECLPNILKETMQSHASAISEQLAQSQTQLSRQLKKRINKHFHLADQTKTKKFVVPERALTREIHSKLLDLEDILHSTGEQLTKLYATSKSSKAETQGEQPPNTEVVNNEQALIVHPSQTKKDTKVVNVANNYDSEGLDKEPLSKRFKISANIPAIPSPKPLKSLISDPLILAEQQKQVTQFTKNLFETTYSKFSPEPPREPSPARDPTKGKGVATDDFTLQITQLLEEGGSAQKSVDLKEFNSPATVKAQELKWKEHEEKKAKMLNDYNDIFFRADPFPITKISYTIDTHKIPTMRITRDHDSLNLTVMDNFKLKMLGFSQISMGTDDGQSLKAKFQWVLNQAKKVGQPPPPELATFGMTTEQRKRKRSKMIRHTFVKDDVEVDGTQRNVAPPAGVSGKIGHVIREPEAGLQRLITRDSQEARDMINLMEYEIESRNNVTKAREIVEKNLDGLGNNVLGGDEVQLSAKHQLTMKGLSECKASESNIRRIQVKDTVKEVEDYLKAYSSAGMDNS